MAPRELTLLGEIAEIFVGLARHGKGLSTNENHPTHKLIGLKALQAHGLDFEAIETVHVDPEFDYSYYQIAAHDLLLACRATEMRIVLAPREVAGMLIDANVMAIRCGPRLAPQVLAAYLRHPVAGRTALEQASQSTTAQKNLTVKAMKRLALPLPPRAEQQQLVQLLEAAELQYQLALQAAEKRILVAQQVVLNVLYRGSGNGSGASLTHDT